MKLIGAVLEVMRGAGGAAIVMSIGCSPARPEQAPVARSVVSPVVMMPISSAPIVMIPLPPLPRGADAPPELAPLPAAESAPEDPPAEPIQTASELVPRVHNSPLRQPDEDATDPAELLLGGDRLIGPGRQWPDSIPSSCGRG